MDDFEYDALRIVTRNFADTVTIAWQGVSDMQNAAEVIGPYLSRLLGAMKEGGKCRIDFCRLEYMNSATVSPVVRFVKDLDTAAVQTEIVFSSKVDWQRTSYRAFRAMSLRTHNIDVVTQ